MNHNVVLQTRVWSSCRSANMPSDLGFSASHFRCWRHDCCRDARAHNFMLFGSWQARENVRDGSSITMMMMMVVVVMMMMMMMMMVMMMMMMMMMMMTSTTNYMIKCKSVVP
jgi:hypothetical protein